MLRHKRFLKTAVLIVTISFVFSAVGFAQLENWEFVKPLEEQNNRIQAMAEEMKTLQPGAPQDRIIAAGENFIQEAESFQKLLRSFLDHKTRKGLDIEFDYIKQSSGALFAALLAFQEFGPQKPPKPTAEQKQRVQSKIEKFTRSQAKFAVELGLLSEGAYEMLQSESFNEALENVANQTADKAMQKVQNEIDQLVSRFGEDIFYADSVLSGTFLRERAYEACWNQVAKMVVKLTSNQFVVELATGIVWQWLEGDLWPRLKEAFRHKGHLERRVGISTASMMRARDRLQELTADEEITKVRVAVAQARGALHATRYLAKDLARSQNQQIKKDFEDGKKILSRAISLTEKRFLINKIEQFDKAQKSLKLTREIISSAQKILAALKAQQQESAETAAIKDVGGRHYYFQNAAQLQSELPVKLNFPQHEISGMKAEIFPELRYIDLKKYKARKAKEGQGKYKVGSTKYEKFKKIYRQSPHVVRYTANGITRYTYWSKTHAHSGADYCYGLREGLNTVQATMTSEDGFTFSQSYTVVVKKGQLDPDFVARSQEHLEKKRSEYQALPPAKKDEKLYGLVGSFVTHAENMLKKGAARPDDVIPLLEEAGRYAADLLKRSAPVEKNQRMYAERVRLIIDRCFQLCTPASYALAQNIFSQAEKNIRTPEATLKMLDAYKYMAHLALGADNDVGAARRYITKYLSLIDYGSDPAKAERKKKSEWNRWPEKKISFSAN